MGDAVMKPQVRNDSPNGWVVQKFGGTSVGKFPVKIADDIVRFYLNDNKVAVVCSARSSGKKITGTTSRLLEVYRRLSQIDYATGSDEIQTELLDEANNIISDIRVDHFSAADVHILDQNLKETLKQEVQKECQELIEYIHASKRFKLEINSRSKDRVVSFGERLSCVFMTYVLKDRNVDAEYVDLADALHCNPGQHLDHSFYVNAAATFRARVLACGDRVPVITGFFGNVPGSLMDGDVGRGYTDLCAALIAVGMKADELQIWKEVDGIFTADPTKVPTARLLASITPSEAAELTFYGSEVIHHLTMDQVIKASPPIPVRIKNVKNPRGDGTIVIPNPVLAPGQELRRSRPSEINMARKTPRRPTAVTSKPKITVINVHSNKRSIAHGFVAKVFAILDRYGISVDLISTSEVHISMAIHIQNSDVETMDKAANDLQECGDVSVIRGMAILSLVGADMKNMIGVAGKMFTTLGDHNVNIEMISQGASEINISCVIDERDATRAMNVLHTSLFTFLE